MRAAILALIAALAAPAPAAAPASKPSGYGVLVLAFGVDGSWRKDVAELRRRLPGATVESVERVGGSSGSIAAQKAVDKLARLRVERIVAVPLEAVTESPNMEEARYLFGVRAEPPPRDRPDSAQRAPKELKSIAPTALKLAPDPGPRGLKRLSSPVPLVLVPAMDRSPLLAQILADRAKAMSRQPARDAIVLAGIAPRSDEAAKAWRTAAQAVAEQAKSKGGFRAAAVVGLRDGVRASQQEKDLRELRETFRGLSGPGRVLVVPLGLNAEQIGRLLRRDLAGVAYRWDGKGAAGDKRLLDWIESSAKAGLALPDSRRYRDEAGGFTGGR